jgi:hypothetical protein
MSFHLRRVGTYYKILFGIGTHSVLVYSKEKSQAIHLLLKMLETQNFNGVMISKSVITICKSKIKIILS